MTTLLPTAFREPMPEYMSRLLMRGARFVEGNTGEGQSGDGQSQAQTPTPADLFSKGDKGGDLPTTKPATDKAGEGDEPLGEPGKKALEVERQAKRDAEKRASDAEAKLRQYEDANKTELERAQEAATAAATERDSARREAWLYKALVDYPVPAEHRHLITGNTAEEVIAAAESVSQLVNRPGVVKESGRSGDTSKTGSITEMRRQIAASRNRQN